MVVPELVENEVRVVVVILLVHIVKNFLPPSSLSLSSVFFSNEDSEELISAPLLC